MTFWGPRIRDYRWESYDHAKLYEMVKSGKGAGVIAEADQAWTSFAQLMDESQDRIERLQREAGVSWEGQAADTMAEGVSPLSGWARESATAGEQTKTSLQQIACPPTSAGWSPARPTRTPSASRPTSS